jgi:hypothetical protein
LVSDMVMDFGFRDFVWEGCGTGCRRDVAVVSTEKLDLDAAWIWASRFASQ